MKRLLLVPMGLLVGVLLVELSLQALAFVVRSRVVPDLPSAWLTGTVRVLCLGDSNTYGLYLEREQAYPAQLERLWNEQVGSPRLQVLNLGVPGMNSSSLLSTYRDRLESLAPDVVLVMIGANDFWTLPVPVSEDDPAAGWLDTLRRRSRIYRYFCMILHGSEKPPVEVDLLRRDRRGSRHEVRVGDQRFEVEWSRSLESDDDRDERALGANLATLARRSSESGVPLYLMTYPSERPLYARANRVIQETSLPDSARIVDLADAFASRCTSPECPELLFGDGHANADGYRVVSEALAERLARDRPFP